VQVFGGQLRLRLLLARHLLLLELLNFELKLVEVKRAFFFSSLKLLAVELLQTAVLFDSLLQVGLVLRRNVLYFLVESLYLNLRNS